MEEITQKTIPVGGRLDEKGNVLYSGIVAGNTLVFAKEVQFRTQYENTFANSVHTDTNHTLGNLLFYPLREGVRVFIGKERNHQKTSAYYTHYWIEVLKWDLITCELTFSLQKEEKNW